MKLIPRFSLRFGLLALTTVALLAVSLRAAVLGEPWAIGAGIGVISIPALLLVHMGFYLAARLMSRPPKESAPSIATPNATSPPNPGAPT